MKLYRLAVLAIAAGITLAACGSGYSSDRSAGADASRPKPPPATAGLAVRVATANSSLGLVLVDGARRTLYGFTDDANGTSTCDGACATAWPPVVVASATLPAGADAKVFSVITRTDGSFQLKAGKWPLYRFAGDSAPGDTNGQGSGGTWFAAAPDGSLIKN